MGSGQEFETICISIKKVHWDSNKLETDESNYSSKDGKNKWFRATEGWCASCAFWGIHFKDSCIALYCYFADQKVRTRGVSKTSNFGETRSTANYVAREQRWSGNSMSLQGHKLGGREYLKKKQKTKRWVCSGLRDHSSKPRSNWFTLTPGLFKEHGMEESWAKSKFLNPELLLNKAYEICNNKKEWNISGHRQWPNPRTYERRTCICSYRDTCKIVLKWRNLDWICGGDSRDHCSPIHS